MMVVVPWQQQAMSEMGDKLENRRALWEERVVEEVTSFTLQREAGTEIRSHMADQNLKLGKPNDLLKPKSHSALILLSHFTDQVTFHRRR